MIAFKGFNMFCPKMASKLLFCNWNIFQVIVAFSLNSSGSLVIISCLILSFPVRVVIVKIFLRVILGLLGKHLELIIDVTAPVSIRQKTDCPSIVSFTIGSLFPGLENENFGYWYDQFPLARLY